MRIDRGDIPPGAEAAIRRFQGSLAAVATQAAHLRRIADEPIQPFAGIDEAHLDRMATMSTASAEMASAATAIRQAECSWREIVEGYRRQPPEVVDLIRQGIPFTFATARLAPPGAPAPGRVAEARRPEPLSSLYDDHDDDDQSPESWLE